MEIVDLIARIQARDRKMGEMGETEILICPVCYYKRHLTQAESCIVDALVVACLKCGAPMRCNSKHNRQAPETLVTSLQPYTFKATEGRIVP